MNVRAALDKELDRVPLTEESGPSAARFRSTARRRSALRAREAARADGVVLVKQNNRWLNNTTPSATSCGTCKGRLRQWEKHKDTKTQRRCGSR
jgi:hypothetical protein